MTDRRVADRRVADRRVGARNPLSRASDTDDHGRSYKTCDSSGEAALCEADGAIARLFAAVDVIFRAQSANDENKSHVR